MPVETEVPPTRRQRTVNFGDAIDLVGGRLVPLPNYSAEQSRALAVYVECSEMVVPPNLFGTADFRLMVQMDWGSGNASTLSDFDCTYRQRIPAVGASVKLSAWIAAFPYFDQVAPIGSFYKNGLGGANGPLEAPRAVTAKARVFISEGTDPVRLYPSFWMTQQDATAGLYVVGQGRLSLFKYWAAVLVFDPFEPHDPTFDGPWLQLFDEATLPSPGDVPFDSTPLVAGIEQRVLGQGQTRGFVNGLSWGISGEPFFYEPTFLPISAFTTAEFEE
jgi:hypothetical protein